MTGSRSEIVRAFGIVQNDMKRQLGGLDVGQFSEVQAGRVLRDLNGTLDALNRYAAKWARVALARRYGESQAKARTRLEMIGAKRNKGYDKGRHDRAIDDKHTETLKDFLKATGAMRTLVGAYIEALRRHSGAIMQVQEFDTSILGAIGDEFIGGLVADALANNKARGWVSRQIMSWLRGNLADGNYIQIGTRMYNVRDYAELVARTRMIEAASEATKESCREYENDLVEFSSHGDPCERCAELEGQVFSISGNDAEYPMLTDDVTPPIHPYCEHGLYATSRISMKWK